jgi:hypothetical protein
VELAVHVFDRVTDDPVLVIIGQTFTGQQLIGKNRSLYFNVLADCTSWSSCLRRLSSG